jgi:two-component system chemotaxis sensor kinase CheA
MMDYKIFDSLLEPVLVIQKDQTVVYCNEPAALLAELSPRKIVRSKMKVYDLFSWDQPVQAFANLTPELESTPYQEVTFRTPNGKTGRLQVTVQFSTQVSTLSSVSPSPGDGEWICFFRDVTLEETLQKKYRGELEQKETYILELQKAKNELELYSQNLEKMAQERTAEIKILNSSMKALLDSLSQGFLIFDSKGLCSPVYSKACLDVLEGDPTGLNIWSLLKLNEKETESFKKWMTAAFSEMLPFEDIAPLGLPRYKHSQNRQIKLSYSPIRSETGSIEQLVLIAEDITRLVVAEEQAEKDRAQVQMILSVLSHKKQILSFFNESQRLIDELEHLTKNDFSPQKAFIGLHTLKGAAAQLHFFELSQSCHAAEDHLAQFSTTPEWMSRFKEFVHEFKEIRTQTFSRLSPILGPISELQVPKKEVSLLELQNFYLQLCPISAELSQNFIEQFLSEPLFDLLKPFEEMSLNLAQHEGKKLKPFSFKGPFLRVNPQQWGGLISSLVHVFRNSVDHGLESPEQRRLRNKDEDGQISICVEELEYQIVLRIADDGAGIDVQKLRAKIKAQGEDDSQMTDFDVLQLVFRPNLSLKEEVSALSGRGVGMDAVMANVLALGGTCFVQSTLHKGTEVVLKIPKQIQSSNFLKRSA